MSLRKTIDHGPFVTPAKAPSANSADSTANSANAGHGVGSSSASAITTSSRIAVTPAVNRGPRGSMPRCAGPGVPPVDASDDALTLRPPGCG
jgi:hypothetical protein